MRKTAILHSANRHFATHGYRGASLRDIARDASVSLTLLNHHFGSKFDLLCAVMDAHRGLLDERVAQVRGALRPGAPAPSLDLLIADWASAALQTAADADGLNYLRLLWRVVDDPSAEASHAVRDRLEEMAQSFISALMTMYPAASRQAAASAYLLVTAALLKYAISGERLAQLAGAAPAAAAAGAAPTAEGTPTAPGAEADQARLVRFLAAGVHAILSA